MIKKGTLKGFDQGTYTASVQIDGSMGVWLEGIPVSHGIPSGEMTPGRKCAVIFFDESSPTDAVVAAVYES